MLMVTIPMTMIHANDMPLLDMMPMGYDWNYVNSLFSSLGNNGRLVYQRSQLPLDMIYPFLFAITYAMLLGLLLRKSNQFKPPLWWLCCLPILAGMADYLENFWILKMLSSYPELHENTVTTANTFTWIKSMSTMLFFGVVFAVLVKMLWNEISKSKYEHQI